MNPWESFEALPGLIAVPAVWRNRMGPRFAAFNALCLQSTTQKGEWVPCPQQCGCDHRVKPQPDGSLLALCTCDPPRCPPFPVTEADITGLEVNWDMLGHAICNAFGFTNKVTALPPLNTIQIGACPSNAVPAILTMQVYRYDFRSVVAQLVATLNQPFILFAPTSDQYDAQSLAMLERCGAAFFPLDSTVILNENGTLLPARPPRRAVCPFLNHPYNSLFIAPKRSDGGTHSLTGSLTVRPKRSAAGLIAPNRRAGEPVPPKRSDGGSHSPPPSTLHAPRSTLPRRVH